MKSILLNLFLLSSLWAVTQDIVPDIYTNIHFNGKKGFSYEFEGKKIYDVNEAHSYNLPNMMGRPEGTGDGFAFDFELKTFSGILHYGLVNFDDYRYAQPVFFKKPVKIQNGVANIKMSYLEGKYDMVSWQKNKRGHLAYRVIDDKGLILYDGIFAFEKNQGFKVLPSIIEGPMLSVLTDSSVVIRFKTNRDAFCSVKINGQLYKEMKPSTLHEISVQDLSANQNYVYELECSGNTYKYDLTTAPKTGTRQAFTFAYASDSRAGKGGGERNIYGTNAYIVKKTVALALQQESAFMQFTGDMINGYSENIQSTQLQYANYKRVVSPFASYMPIYFGIGNHEVVERYFPIEGEYGVHIDRFPFDRESMEAIFAQEFTHPENGPISEDGMSYDPNPDKVDFPTYLENVYYYTYDNIAMIVLNTEYIYTPSLTLHPETSGGLHGYMMDKQLDWLEATLKLLEKDENIDHVFVSHHTPAFPNGGHVGDAMWYRGDNQYRTIIAGQPMEKGIIEQRDVYLDIIINKSSKVCAILSGDEHNYCKTEISEAMPRYPENWDKPKLNLKRSIMQINNGACGAPYYAQEQTPWSDFVSGFSTQNALVLIDVDGKKVKARVLNPDTLEEIERFDIK